MNLIIYLCYLVITSCLEVQLNIERNNTIDNYTINYNNTKNNLFNAENLFFSKCECNYNNDVFYVSPNSNKINFTINTTQPYYNDTKIENPNLYVNPFSKDK